ncbi:MAG: hypothetical protein AAF429_03050 [Pseudomonadota bacterium]
MAILIFENKRKTGLIWQRFLARHGCNVRLTRSIDETASALSTGGIHVFIVDATEDMNAITTLSDLAQFYNPDISIIAVTSGMFFADGSVFELIPNIRSCISTEIPPEDLAAMVEHFELPLTSQPVHVAAANL